MKSNTKLIAIGIAIIFSALVFLGTATGLGSYIAWVSGLSSNEQLVLRVVLALIPIVAVVLGVWWRRTHRSGESSDS